MRYPLRLEHALFLILAVMVQAGCSGARAEPSATPTRTPLTSVSTGYYRFHVGDIECVCLSDGSYDYAPRSVFANIPADRVEEALRQRNLPTDAITSTYSFLYVNTGEHRVLVDTGAGTLGPDTGKLLPSMEAAGIDPDQIDTVIITHAHLDHVGGIRDPRGELIYGNASYYISKAEWDFWFSEEAKTQRSAGSARRNLKPIEDRVNLVEGESQIVPGISVVPAPGHTPGHMIVSVSAGEEKLLYIADTATHPLHLEYPDWHSAHDILPEEAAASKRRIFDWAAAENTLVMGTHFAPFPSLGTVVSEGEGWQWRPIDLGQFHLNGARGRRGQCQG